MKTNFTSVKYAILLIAVIFSKKLSAQGPQFNFNSTPVLISGTNLAIGSKYRFNNVASGTSAVVTITGATGGATVAILDDNSLTKPEAFSPQINIPANKTGMVEFKIEFFVGVSNTPKNIPLLIASAMDVDGSAGSLYEKDALDMGGGTLTYQASPLEISVVKTGTEFMATNVVGFEYPGVDTSAKQVMFTVANTNISSFTYKAGAINLLSGSISRQKGIYFKPFSYINLVILPVKYAFFEGLAVDKDVLLKWATLEEINNDYFEIERSFDGVNFTVIGTILDGIEGSGQKNYQFKDANVLKAQSVVHYRLKQVDYNGKATYTNSIIVKTQMKSDVVIEVGPNPFIENLNVRFIAMEADNAEISIINSNGQRMIAQQLTLVKGYNMLKINGLSRLSKGVYVAQLIKNGATIGVQKIIKN